MLNRILRGEMCSVCFGRKKRHFRFEPALVLATGSLLSLWVAGRLLLENKGCYAGLFNFLTIFTQFSRSIQVKRRHRMFSSIYIRAPWNQWFIGVRSYFNMLYSVTSIGDQPLTRLFHSFLTVVTVDACWKWKPTQRKTGLWNSLVLFRNDAPSEAWLAVKCGVSFAFKMAASGWQFATKSWH